MKVRLSKLERSFKEIEGRIGSITTNPKQRAPHRFLVIWDFPYLNWRPGSGILRRSRKIKAFLEKRKIKKEFENIKFKTITFYQKRAEYNKMHTERHFGKSMADALQYETGLSSVNSSQ